VRVVLAQAFLDEPEALIDEVGPHLLVGDQPPGAAPGRLAAEGFQPEQGRMASVGWSGRVVSQRNQVLRKRAGGGVGRHGRTPGRGRAARGTGEQGHYRVPYRGVNLSP
jgi:hypothetical protein